MAAVLQVAAVVGTFLAAHALGAGLPYSYPLVPLIAVMFALAARKAWRWTGNERPRRRSA